MREFLGSAGFCRLWILEFAELACPLNETTRKGKLPLPGLYRWKKTFEEIKAALVNTPALALPEVSKPFHLCVDKKRELPRGTDISP